MEKLLAILGIIQRANGRRQFQQLLPNIITVGGLMVVTSIMVSAALISGLIVTYFLLVQYEIVPQVAMIIIAISAIFTIMMLVMLTLSRLQRLKQMLHTMLDQSPLTSRVIATLDAFKEGLMAD